MYIKRFVLLIVFSFVLLLLLSCGINKEKFRQEVTSIADEINSKFVEILEENRKFSQKIRDTLNTDQNGVSIEKMDISQGGPFEFFNGYYLTPQGKRAISANSTDGRTNFTSVGDDLKKELMLILSIEDEFVQLSNKLPIVNNFYCALFRENYMTGYNLPSLDWKSALPPPQVFYEVLGGNFRNLPFISIVNSKNNPKREVIFTPDIIVPISGEGILLDCAAPIYLNDDDDDIFGVTILSCNMNAFNQALLFDNEEFYLLSTASNNITGASKMAKDTFDIKLPYHDYTEQLKTSMELGDTFKFLNYEDEGIKTIGEKINAGENEFEITIKGKDYLAITADIPVVNFTLIGLKAK